LQASITFLRHLFWMVFNGLYSAIESGRVSFLAAYICAPYVMMGLATAE
jgi:hypothetical protein